MKTVRTKFLSFTCACTILTGCDATDPVDGGADGNISLTLFGLPESDTLRQTGLEFAFESSGSGPHRSVVVVVDPGTADERIFSVDSAWRAEAPARFPVVVTGPLANGSHLFELRVEDAAGRKGTSQFTRVVHVPEVPYTVQFLGDGFDDSGAIGITASGLIAGTVITGEGSSRIEQVVSWAGGELAKPKAQPSVTKSAASGISSHGEIVGNATVNGDLAGFLWRGDSVEVLTVDGQRSMLARDIDDSHRALVLTPGFGTYFVDVLSGNATSVPMSGVPGFRMNGLGQMIGVTPQLYGTTIVTYGGLTLDVPAERPGRHERLRRGVNWQFLGLNDRAEVLGARDGEPFLSHSDTVEYLDHRLPLKGTGFTVVPPQIANLYCLSASGDVVVLRGGDSLYMWSPAKGTRRLTFTNPGWTIDALSAMNVHGQLIAHGVNTAGQKGALLLSPATSTARKP